MHKDTVFSVRFSSQDLRALDALAACLGLTRGEVIRLAVKEAAARRGVWNVTSEAALPLLTVSNGITTK